MNRVGVLALQGDYQKHATAFQMASESLTLTEVRTPEDLDLVDRLVIPGGESTTVGLLLTRFGLDAEIKKRVSSGMPIWGTCMGMIMLATHVEGSNQPTLGVLHITVRRNAFGAQIHSFEDSVQMPSLNLSVTGVFIRAPIVTAVGPEVEVLATYDEKVVAVRKGPIVGTSFHPELTDDASLHTWFLHL